LPAQHSTNNIIAHIDGGSRGNPGPAAYAAVIKTPDGSPVASLSEFLGNTTNNCAEYQALLAALRYAVEHGYRALEVVSDSELLVRQLQGRYKVRSPGLTPLYDAACKLISQLSSFRIRHVMREENQEADRLANEAMDVAQAEPRKPAIVSPRRPSADLLRASAIFRAGRLELDRDLALREGEIVELEIRRKN
jgi:ribonuclease HI